MASTFTTNIRLTKQGDGENPNSWGQILNDGVISLTDEAIAGIATISVGSTTSVTLTSNNGSDDQSRSAILHIKGTVGGAHNTISLVIPGNTKHYLINNAVSANTTASDIIKIKTAAAPSRIIVIVLSFFSGSFVGVVVGVILPVSFAV